MNKNQVLKIGFKNIPVRLILVRLTDVWQEIKSHNNTSKSACSLLGEALAASALLMSNIKIEGSVSLQIQSTNSDLSMLFAECSHKFGMRGIVNLKNEIKDLDINSLINGNSHFVVNILPEQKHLNSYQGIIPLHADDNGSFNMQRAISNYMRDSEQIDTNIWLISDDNVSVGMLLQKMPSEGGYNYELEEDWVTIKHLASTVRKEELLNLDLLTIVQLLFNDYIEQEKVVVLEDKSPYFYCTCSLQKAENAIKTALVDASVDEIMENKQELIVDCNFCAKKYRFSYSDCGKIYHSLYESKKI